MSLQPKRYCMDCALRVERDNDNVQRYIRFPFVICIVLVMVPVLAEALPAFPGAEGSGVDTPGGRGGRILLVTSLDDTGPGTLREACEAEGPRMVIVNVDGIIDLESPIDIRDPQITIAGQAAPGDGVCLKNYGLRVSADDVVIRYLRIRPGDGAGGASAGIDVDGAERVVIDHCSITWTTGPAIAVSAASHDVTVQWCMLAETLFDPEANSEKRGIGMTLAGADSTHTIHHNYFAHHNIGSPLITGADKSPGPILDFRNNVVYDWGQWAGTTASGPVRYNIVGNSYKAGPSTPHETRSKAFQFDSVESRIHGRENALVGSDMATGVNFFMWEMPGEYILRVHMHVFQPDDPFPAEPVTTLSHDTAMRRVLTESGATRPRRDEVDTRIAAQYRLGAGRVLMTSAETGGWPEYAAEALQEDADLDGMPDDWERKYGLTPQDPADHALDLDGDEYTNIEEYLNSSPPGPLVTD